MFSQSVVILYTDWHIEKCADQSHIGINTTFRVFSQLNKKRPRRCLFWMKKRDRPANRLQLTDCLRCGADDLCRPRNSKRKKEKNPQKNNIKTQSQLVRHSHNTSLFVFDWPAVQHRLCVPLGAATTEMDVDAFMSLMRSNNEHSTTCPTGLQLAREMERGRERRGRGSLQTILTNNNNSNANIDCIQFFFKQNAFLQLKSTLAFTADLNFWMHNCSVINWFFTQHAILSTLVGSLCCQKIANDMLCGSWICIVCS